MLSKKYVLVPIAKMIFRCNIVPYESKGVLISCRISAVGNNWCSWFMGIAVIEKHK